MPILIQNYMLHVCLGNLDDAHDEELERASRTGEELQWTINSKAKQGDNIAFYIRRPLSAFIATGRVISDPQRNNDSKWPDKFTVKVANIKMLQDAMPYKDLEFPEWTCSPHEQSTTIPEEVEEDFWIRLNIGRPEIESTIAEAVYSVVSDPLIHRAAAKKLLAIFSDRGVRYDRKIGSQQGKGNNPIYWFPEQGFWSSVVSINQMWWIPLGGEDPEHTESLGNELNVNFGEGSGKGRGGVLLQHDGRLFLGHIGIVKGSKTKADFLNYYRENHDDTILIRWPDGTVHDAMVVCEIVDSPILLEELGQFLRLGVAVKRGARASEVNEEEDVHSSGKLNALEVGERVEVRDYWLTARLVQPKREHAVVVNDMIARLRASNISTHRSDRVDLVVTLEQEATFLEIKSDVTSDSLLKAIGQLIYYNARFGKSKATTLMVIPRGMSAQDTEILQRLHIFLITYEWKGNELVYDCESSMRREIKSALCRS